ncbi:MAG: hypothetical protein P4M09_26790 [Devosia sp.]|nr:hypothetical protein [Devosia sp.]
MDMHSIFAAIEASPVGVWVRESPNVLPYVNVLHVIAIAIVFGTIFIVDLRLLDFPNSNRAFTRVAHDGLKWTWAGFGLAAITGLLMFTANATTFLVNTPFWLKMGAIGLAGLNMFIFELLTVKTAAAWDRGAPTPRAAKVAGMLSILLWASVIILGRVIGYTKGVGVGEISIDLNNLNFLN